MPALPNPKHERFYVYAVRVDGQTRYVGKGCGKRAQIHLKRSHNGTLAAEINAARATGRPARVRIIVSGLTEAEAFRLERRAIAKWSPRLTNVSMGSHTEMERSAMTARANLKTLKSENEIRHEGSWLSVPVEARLLLLRKVTDELQQIATAA